MCRSPENGHLPCLIETHSASFENSQLFLLRRDPESHLQCQILKQFLCLPSNKSKEHTQDHTYVSLKLGCNMQVWTDLQCPRFESINLPAGQEFFLFYCEAVESQVNFFIILEWSVSIQFFSVILILYNLNLLQIFPSHFFVSLSIWFYVSYVIIDHIFIWINKIACLPVCMRACM